MSAISARKIAADIKGGSISAKEALADCLQRAEAGEDSIGAFESLSPDWSPGSGPLRGLAVGVKDIFDTHDMPTAYGSPIYEGHRPKADAAIVTMLRERGATIAGKTVTTEFAWFEPGKTRNPHNLDHTPGGSSSGSAAGVAAGFFHAAVGSQTGGSIIRPAAFCGVAGYKPSYRLFPTIGMKHFSQLLDTAGFFAKDVADTAFVAAHCSGRDLLVDEMDTTAPKIGIYRSSIDDQMDADMAATMEQLGGLLQKWGATVGEVPGIAEIEVARGAHAPISEFEAAHSLADEYNRHRELLSSRISEFLERARTITPDAYDQARSIANRGRKASQQLFQNFDVILYPSAPGTAPATLSSTGDSIFNQVWTLLGLPCVNVPGMSGKNGLPLGVQIIAPFGKDKAALQAAHWLETKIASEGI